MREIELTNGQVATIDDEDYEKVSQHTWHAIQKEEHWYAARTIWYPAGTSWHLYLHVFLMEPPDGMEVDHIDHNTLDDRRSNMRLATRSQNAINRTMPQGENGSGYRGVKRVPSGRWQALVIVNGKRHHIGTFDTVEEAARARDEAAKRLHGEFAWLNFP